MSASGLASGSTRNIARLVEVGARVPVSRQRLGERLPRLLAGRHRREVVPQPPITAVLRDRLAVVRLGGCRVALLGGDVAEVAPRLGRPPLPVARLLRLRPSLLVIPFREGPLARREGARAYDADEGYDR